MKTFDQYGELGDFLRTRRALVDPENVGFPAGLRRRASGLLREEVAVLAHVSPAWYVRLEQGHRVQPSPKVLDSVAEALRLSDVERRYLCALGTGGSAGALGGLEARPDTVDLVRRVVDGHSAAALPVYAIDHKYDLIAWNSATKHWYDDFDDREGLDRNLVWWMFTDPAARRVLPDWSACARDMVAAIRFAVGTGRTDPARQPVVALLRSADQDFARWWDTHDVLEPEVEHRTFQHPRQGRCTLKLLTMRPGTTTAISIVHHLAG
ncbi:MAG TPA: helix-turn-helix transcriptional regulator [Pseudonocardiaceae bacterium]|nr:helix-turn-helix transcriptional regulator [Pseudonocardiaceae bacterium]